MKFLLFEIKFGNWSSILLGLVAAALTIILLVQYWFTLAASEKSAKVKLLLISLRGVALLLLICAIADLRLVFKGMHQVEHKQILLRNASNLKSNAAQAVLWEKITTSLRQQGYTFESEAFAGLLLVSGPIDSRIASEEMARTSAASGGRPVYAIVSAPSPQFISLESIRAPDQIVRGTAFIMTVDIRAHAMKGDESLVLLSNDGRTEDSMRLKWTDDDQFIQAELHATPKINGWNEYKVRIETEGARHGISQRDVPLYVTDAKKDLLFIEGLPSWEGKFIRRALDEMRIVNVDYFSQISKQEVIGIESEIETEATTAQDQESTQNPIQKLHAILSDISKLNTYEGLIIGPTPDDFLSPTESKNIEQWVAERGGGVILLGGNDFNDSVISASGKLKSLVPATIAPVTGNIKLEDAVTVSRATPQKSSEVVRDVRLIATDEGMAGPLRAFVEVTEKIRADASINNLARRESVNLTGQGLRLRTPHPGATVFAVRKASNEPLIIGQSIGKGNVLVVAPADTWRLRFNYSTSRDQQKIGKDDPYNALWQGLVLWSGAQARPASEIVVSDEAPSIGSRVTIELTANDPATFKPERIEQVDATLNKISDQRPDQTSDTQSETTVNILLAPIRGDQYVWRGKFIAPQSGKYRIIAKFSVGEKSLLVQKMVGISSAPKSQGVTGLSPVDTLRRTARETGGDLYDESQLEELFGSLAKHADNTSHNQYEVMLRAWWPLAIIIPLLLSLEWWLRRRWSID